MNINRLHYNPDNGKLYWKDRKRKGLEAGCLDSDGYRVIRIEGKSYKAHRIVWALINGHFPTDQLDHIDGNKDNNNKLLNLREVTSRQNNQNRKIHREGKFPGIYLLPSGNWAAQYSIKGKINYIGTFTTKEEAYRRYRNEII